MALSVQEILGLEIPSPTWVWNPTSDSPIRSDMDFSRPDTESDRNYGEAMTLAPGSGKYEHRAADVARIHDAGGGQGMVVETGTTERANPSITDVILPNTYTDSIFKGENASWADETDNNSYASNFYSTFTGNVETGAFIIEGYPGNASSEFELQLNETWSGNYDSAAALQVNPRNGNILNEAGGVFSSSVTEIKDNIYFCKFAFDSSGYENAGNSNIRCRVYPSRNNDGGTIMHYVGYRHNDKRLFGTPIENLDTSGGKTKRGNDYVVLPKENITEDWANPNEGTIFITIQKTFIDGDYGDIFNSGGGRFIEVNRGGKIRFNLGPSNTSIGNKNSNPFTPYKNINIALSTRSSSDSRSGRSVAAANGKTAKDQSGYVDQLTDNILDHKFRFGEFASLIYKKVNYYPKFIPEEKLSVMTNVANNI